MPSKRLIKDPVKYKTVLCTTWANTGQCPYNRKCQFAHGKEELRQRTSSSPPQPPQQGQPLPPMMLPLPSAVAGSSGVTPMSGLSLPPMGSSWPATTQWQRCLPSNGAAQNSLLGGSFAPPQQQPSMPPLPPGPPPSGALPHPTPIAPLAASTPGPSQASGLLPPSMPPLSVSGPPQLPLPALLPLGALEAACAPSAELPVSAPAVAPPSQQSLSAADELACFAMQCHLADDICQPDLIGDLLSKPQDGRLSEVPWEPLRCNEITGKVEITGQSPVPPLGVESPLEPTLGKTGRQVSYPTQVVRRAISFVFDDLTNEGPNSPVNLRRSAPAIAA